MPHARPSRKATPKPAPQPSPVKPPEPKIVKKGDLTKKFVLKGITATAGAKAAIEAAGGSVQE